MIFVISPIEEVLAEYNSFLYLYIMKNGIYTITNLKNNKIYVGSTYTTFNHRWSQHISLLKKNNHYNKHLQSAWNKYGEDNFKFEELEICHEDYILSSEQYWINILNTTNPKYGYNRTNVIILGVKTGRKQSPEHLEKNRLKSLGFKHSVETIEKLKEIAIVKREKGELSYWKGKKIPEAIIKKRSKTNYKKVEQLDLNNNFIKVWESIISTKIEGFRPAIIVACCKNKRKTHGGYKWRYRTTKEET